MAAQDELEEFVKKNDKFEIIEAGLKPLDEIISNKNSGQRLWKWFIVSRSLFICGVLLLRFYGKRNSQVKSLTGRIIAYNAE
ncbi:MAG: hypothetical protein IPH20_17860 [Bacteroidales bacterium]|nr:hypothetical protein [Bacteroidales bacterium]